MWNANSVLSLVTACVASCVVACYATHYSKKKKKKKELYFLMKKKQKKLILKYFDIPALGEPIRALLILGGFDWEDDRVGHERWPSLKPETRWGQVPVLASETGETLSQTKAICRYLAKFVVMNDETLYPCSGTDEDAYRAFEIDELLEAFEDARGKLMPTLRVADPAEKTRQRQKLFADDGEITLLLKKIDDVCGKDGHMVAHRLTLADVWCYFFLSLLKCGFLDGIPCDAVDQHKNLTRVRRTVANIPAIREHYAQQAKRNHFYAAFLLDSTDNTNNKKHSSITENNMMDNYLIENNNNNNENNNNH